MIQTRSGRIQCGDGVGRAAIRGGKNDWHKPKSLAAWVSSMRWRREKRQIHSTRELSWPR